ncbi:MAG: hypothetical protein ACI9WU_003639 [Myxococcota bacterium]
MTGPALLILIPLLVWCLPGLLLSRWLLPGADPLQRGATTLTLGIITVAPTTYLIALLGRIPELPGLIFLVSGMWVLVGYALSRYVPLHKAFGWAPEQDFALPSEARSGALLFTILIASAYTALATQPFALETTEVWWHCPHLSSLYLIEDGNGPGVVSWDPAWQQWVSHLFQHPLEPAYGMGPVLGIQRPGNTAFMVQILALMSSSGHVAALWCTDFLIMSYGVLLLGRSLRHPALLLGLAGVFHLGARALAGYQVNENTLGLALSMALLHLLLRPGGATIISAAACGAVAAHLAGVRPVTLVLAPAIFWLLAIRDPAGNPIGHRIVASFIVMGLVMATPWMTAHWQGLGSPLAHPVVGRTYPLNWPFTDAIVAAAQHPFPNLIRIPLEQLRALGAPALALVGAGLFAVGRRRALNLLLWALPIQLMLMAIIILDYQKLSYGLLGLAPLPLLMGAGAAWLWPIDTRRLAGVGGLCVTLLVVPALFADVRFEQTTLQPSDYRHDPRENWNEATKRAVLTAPSFGPYLGRDLAGGGLPGWDLLSHARFASASDRDGAILPAQPVSIWAALGESELDHRFQIHTAGQMFIPPGFSRGALHPGGNMAPGITLLLVELPAPAATVAEVRLTRTQGRLDLDVRSVGTSTVDEVRWVSVLVLDRQHPYGAGRFTLDGRKRRPFVATLSYVRDGGWLTTPRLISNSDRFGWTPDGITVDAPARAPIAQGGASSALCMGSDGRVYSHGSKRLLAGEGGALRAVGVGTGVASRVLGWGYSFPIPADSADPCTQRLLGPGLSDPL